MAEFVTEHPDRFLVARIVRGDEAAFGEFFESHFAPLFRFAMPRAANDARVAEDIVQAALFRAVRNWRRIAGTTPVGSATYLTRWSARTTAIVFASICAPAAISRRRTEA
jgi:DNA-directed RNA polymerase specialized sigma24 family protein